MGAAIIGLVGVFMGFCLSVGYRELNLCRNRKEMKLSLIEELRANLYMVPQKRDMIEQIILHLNNGKFLPGTGVRFLRVFYDTHFTSIFPILSLKERNSLHILYEYFRTIDWLLETYAEHIIEAMGTEKIDDYLTLYSAMMGDVLNVLNLTEKLITSHLEGKPKDVLSLKNEEYVKVISAKFTDNP